MYRFDLGASAWTCRSVRGPERRLFRFEAFFFDVLASLLVSIAILIVLPLLETFWRLNYRRHSPNTTECFRNIIIIFSIAYMNLLNLRESP